MDKVPKKKIVAVNFICIVLFLDFFTLEDGIDMLSQNFGKELPLNAA
jgi:hypothetical protein